MPHTLGTDELLAPRRDVSPLQGDAGLRRTDGASSRARGTADPDERAALVSEAEKLAAQQLP